MPVSFISKYMTVHKNYISWLVRRYFEIKVFSHKKNCTKTACRNRFAKLKGQSADKILYSVIIVEVISIATPYTPGINSFPPRPAKMLSLLFYFQCLTPWDDFPVERELLRGNALKK